MDTKPRIFIGSSSENLKFAHAVHMFLNNTYAYTKLWETSVEVSEYTLPALLRTFEEYDYGIFIFAKDDIVNIREKQYSVVRDNVLFEFGIFLGKRGINNAFILTPQEYLKDGRIASDLFGITVEKFDSNRGEHEIQDAVSSSCLKILARIKGLSELTKTSSVLPENQFLGICYYESNMYSELVDMISNTKNKVIFVITNNERLIIFDLFVTIYYAILNGISIEVHYYPQIQKDVESYSIEVFRQLGCNVKIYEIGLAPESVTFISDPYDEDYSKSIIKSNRFSRKNIFAYSYKGAIHHNMIKAFYQGLDKLPEIKNFIPKLVSVSNNDIQKSFRGIPMYRNNNCQFEVKEVDASATLPQSDNLVREYKIKQIELLEKIYFANKFKLFEPTAVILKNKKKHLIVPPILELQGGKLLIAEGHTRLFMHKQSGKKITCVVVTGMTLPLPSQPATWDKIQIAPDSVFRIYTHNEHELQYTRKSEKYLHKGDWHN